MVFLRLAVAKCAYVVVHCRMGHAARSIMVTL